MPTQTTGSFASLRAATQPVQDLCQHHQNCQCQRPQLGRAIVVVVVLQLLMACITIASGATLVGLVACIAMGGCAWLAAVAEVIAYYRIGLDTPQIREPRNIQVNRYKANQM